jgi:fatty acid desaturase
MRQAGKTPVVTPKDLQRAVADLQTTELLPGLGKYLVCAVWVLSAGYFAFTADSIVTLIPLAALTGIGMSCWMITTHDAIHHTLTGNRLLDEILPRLISWPIIWVHGTYAEVHKIHHKMNGDDFADPERVQRTVEEYEAAGPVLRFYIRHQWLLDIMIFGGFGLIYKTVKAAWRYLRVSGSIRRALLTDLAGIVTTQALIMVTAAAYGHLGRWLLLYLVMERCSGAVLQWRAHVEHYGLWGRGRNYFETQVYSCRNISTSAFTSWYFNRLNYHSVHHAFPRVPFHKLALAHERFQALYARSGAEPLVQEQSYLRIALRHARRPSLIGPVDEASDSGRRRMIPLR